MTDADSQILWPPDAKKWLTGKDSDAGKDWRQEEKRTTEDEMVGWHHWLDGHEFEQTPGAGDGQGSLACCSPWDCKRQTWLSDWTDLNLPETNPYPNPWKTCLPWYQSLVTKMLRTAAITHKIVSGKFYTRSLKLNDIYVKVCWECPLLAPLNITWAMNMDTSWYGTRSMYFKATTYWVANSTPISNILNLITSIMWRQ